MDPITTTLAVLSVGSQVFGYRAQRKANKLDLQQRLLAARRERVNAVKEAQAARSVLAVQAESGGATGSSAVLGAAASASSQFGGNMGLSLAIDAFGRKSAKSMQKATDWMTAANTFGTLASLSASNQWDKRLTAALSTPEPSPGFSAAQHVFNRIPSMPRPAPMAAPQVSYSVGP